jgi:hypothetical protein
MIKITLSGRNRNETVYRSYGIVGSAEKLDWETAKRKLDELNDKMSDDDVFYGMSYEIHREY